MNNFLWFLIIVFVGLSFDNFNIFRYCIISSILHETGHIMAYKILLKKWPKINISVFGFTMHNDIIYPDKLFGILLGGPMINFIICAVSVLLISKRFRINLIVLFIVNSVIFVLNMLPIYYLDGGQLLYIISPFYQKYYIQISIISIILISVMVIYFTGIGLSFSLFILYFIYNTLNDI